MPADISDLLDAYVTEVLELCLGYEAPDWGAVGHVEASTRTLADIRKRLDRVDELLSNTITLRGRLHRIATAAKSVADHAWDTAAMKRRAAPVQRGEEFYSAREREAEANLASINERHTAKQAADQAHTADTAYEVIRLNQRGLERVRTDLLAVMRAVQFESSLDR